jgi:hypothetical protein
VCACACVCVCVSKREKVCVCVCVSECVKRIGASKGIGIMVLLTTISFHHVDEYVAKRKEKKKEENCQLL